MHDGKLDNTKDAWSHAKVRHDGLYGEAGDYQQSGTCIHLSGGFGDSQGITLDAKQALSLLEWLRQEEETLKPIALEQAEMKDCHYRVFCAQRKVMNAKTPRP